MISHSTRAKRRRNASFYKEVSHISVSLSLVRYIGTVLYQLARPIQDKDIHHMVALGEHRDAVIIYRVWLDSLREQTN